MFSMFSAHCIFQTAGFLDRDLDPAADSVHIQVNLLKARPLVQVISEAY